MRRHLICTAALAAFLAPAAWADPGVVHGDRVVADDSKVVKVLERWLKAYRKGKYDVGNIFIDISNKSLGRKAKLISKDEFPDRGGIKPGEFSYRDEIIKLTGIAAKTGSADSAKMLLQIAAVGLDDHYEYESHMSPVWLRVLGEERIGEFNSTAAREYFVQAASGNPEGPKEIHTALQAAAIKVLARFEEDQYLEVMMNGLSSEDPLVRAHAADGVKMIGPASAVEPIVKAFETETSEIAWISYVEALERIFFRNEGQVDEAAFMRGLKTAAANIGKGAWQTDVALIEFVEKFPVNEAVPKLIDIIVKFAEHPELVENGTLTGRQRRAAFEALQKLTGAFYAVDESDEWKEFWARVGDTFQVVDLKRNREELLAEWKDAEAKREQEKQKVGGKREIKTAKKKKETAGTVTNDFFGIPIYGSRVVFVLDVSGSMSLDMQFADPANAKKEWRNGSNRLEVAKEEVRQTIEKLTDDVYFNIIVYHDKVDVWQPKKLVKATAKNKKAAYSFLRKQSPTGNTNIYDGFAKAVELTKLLYGERYEGNVDEMFFLSDGVPNRGAIRNDNDILITINETNRFSKIKINTVFTGKPNDEADRDERGMKLMKRIAEANGGRFIRP